MLDFSKFPKPPLRSLLFFALHCHSQSGSSIFFLTFTHFFNFSVFSNFMLDFPELPFHSLFFFAPHCHSLSGSSTFFSRLFNFLKPPPSFLFAPSSSLHPLSVSIRFFQNGKHCLGDNRRMHIATLRKTLETEQAAIATECSLLFFGHKEDEKCVDSETLFNAICLSTLCASLF